MMTQLAGVSIFCYIGVLTLRFFSYHDAPQGGREAHEGLPLNVVTFGYREDLESLPAKSPLPEQSLREARSGPEITAPPQLQWR